MTHPVVTDITRRLIERSAPTRAAYLERVRAAAQQGPARRGLGCANFAHGFAAAGGDKDELQRADKPNVAIVSSYNDMLSAHQPLADFPEQIKAVVREAGGVAQFAGGVPAMCDGITQGRAGMELSLYSRDVIAMASAIALSHDMFDAALMLGVCDKIVPGLVIGALSFGHLPTLLVPAGPMTTGLSNALKSKIRQQYALGEIGRDELLAAEAAAYHGPGTCTFYGTANSNQMLMELMGLHLPGASFVNPNTPLRTALTEAAGRRAVELAGDEYTPIADIVDEKAVVNGVVALLATGGSTNHTLHLVAMARAAGIDLRWDDFAELSAVVPLLARIYPNGKADINHFHAAGGTAFLVRELVGAGLMHRDVQTVAGHGLETYMTEPTPARVFGDQSEFQAAFEAGELDADLVAVVRYQGPKANGMPELHKLITPLGVLQDRGHRVALVTDGRMSGASGKIPAAIHVTPEAADDESPIARLRDGDLVRLDADAGTIEVVADPAEFAGRTAADPPVRPFVGTGRELFESFRRAVGPADAGASIFGEVA
jgi:phosphogluconate dehydratase